MLWLIGGGTAMAAEPESEIEALRRAAEAGAPDAQYSLGMAYTTGRGVAPDLALAADWFAKAAEQGLPAAQHSFAVCHELGLGVPQDHAQAVIWHRRAAEQGHEASQLRLGLLLSGDSLQEDVADHEEAVRWLSFAVDRGDPIAGWRLGSLLARGLGAARDCERAFLLLREAARGGDSAALYDFGLLYEKGCGIPRDLTEARRWYRMAADRGHVRARERLDTDMRLRAVHLRKARFFDGPTTVRSPDRIRRGPDAPVRFSPDEDVHCDYYPRDNQGGNPKFRCFMMTARIDEGGRYYDEHGVVRTEATGLMFLDTGPVTGPVLATTNGAGEREPLMGRRAFKPRFLRPLVLKVKYRSLDDPRPQDERDMYSEVAATRLLWAVGYPADRMYRPRRVHCHRCPRNPFERPTPAEEGRYTTFGETAVELRYLGDRGETYQAWLEGGWSWGEEVRELRQATGPESFTDVQNAHLDGLIVLMNVLEHVSNLPEQNRFVCLRQGMQQVGAFTKYCSETVLLVHDLGSVFGKKAPGSLDVWRGREIWADRERCEPALEFKVHDDDSIRPYFIGEPGRRFVLGLLDQLTDEHLRALFESAGFERFDITLVPPDEIPSPARAEIVIDAWIAAFRGKIEQVRGVNCEGS
jgi:hypothetical protein